MPGGWKVGSELPGVLVKGWKVGSGELLAGSVGQGVGVMLPWAKAGSRIGVTRNALPMASIQKAIKRKLITIRRLEEDHESIFTFLQSVHGNENAAGKCKQEGSKTQNSIHMRTSPVGASVGATKRSAEKNVRQRFPAQ